MPREAKGLLPVKQQGYMAVAMFFISVGFLVISAGFGVDLAKPGWGLLFVSIYLIFGPKAGEFLLRVVTAAVLGAQQEAERPAAADKKGDTP